MGVWVAGPQPMSTHGAQINFGDLTPYLAYASTSKALLGPPTPPPVQPLQPLPEDDNF
jgi:hypothetical protein